MSNATMIERVSAADVEELQGAIESVLKPLSLEEIKKVHLKATNRWRVPISFDVRWRPFLNWTRGYHHPRELRLYFDLVLRVLRVAETWFKSVQSPRSGGRVFLDGRGIHCDGDILLGTLEWPAGVGVARLIGVRGAHHTW